MFRPVVAILMLAQSGQHNDGAAVLKQRCAEMRAVFTMQLSDQEKLMLEKADGDTMATWTILMESASLRLAWSNFQIAAMQAECQMWNKAAIETEDKNFREFAILRIEEHQGQIVKLVKYSDEVKRIYFGLLKLKPDEA